MTAPAPEKAAPIPAEVIAKLRREAVADNDTNSAARAVMLQAAAILADRASQEERIREALPSLPDSREERIREDEREACAQVARESFGYLLAETDPEWVANRIRARTRGDAT